jgi:hypothetical protein
MPDPSAEFPLADFTPFQTFLPPPSRPPVPQDVPATGEGNLFTAALGSAWHEGVAQGARALQAGAQLAGATDTAQSLSDFADEAHARAQSYARADLEAEPWYSPSGLAYRLTQMVPTTAAALSVGALAAATAPEAAVGVGATALVGAARTAALAAAARTAVFRATAGAATTMFPFAAGENVQRQISETGELTSPGKALALGVPEAVLQGWLPGRLERYFGKGILSGVAHSVAAQGAVAGGTEALTQMMGDPNRDFADRASDITRQALSGGVLGGIVGGAFGGMRALAGKRASDIPTEDLPKAIDPALAPKQLTYQPAMGAPLQGVPDGELAGRIDTLQRQPPQTQAGVEELRQLLQEQQRRAAEAAATQAAVPPPQRLLPPPPTREGPPLQEMPPAELWMRLNNVQAHLELNPQDPIARRASELLGEEFQRRAAEAQPVAVPAAELSAPGVPREPAPAPVLGPGEPLTVGGAPGELPAGGVPAVPVIEPPEPAVPLTPEVVKAAYDQIPKATDIVSIKDLMDATGASREDMHDYLMAEAKAGRVTIHPTTAEEATLPPGTLENAIRLPNDPQSYVNVHFKTPEELARRVAPTAPVAAVAPVATEGENAITEHTRILNNAGTDEGAFNNALTRLMRDTDVKTPEVAEIARQYTGDDTDFKSKSAAIKAIRNEFKDRASAPPAVEPPAAEPAVAPTTAIDVTETGGIPEFLRRRVTEPAVKAPADMTLAELKTHVTDYTGEPLIGKTKGDLLKQIQQFDLRNARFQNKIAPDAPIKTVDDHIPVLNDIVKQLSTLPDSPIKRQLSAETEQVIKKSSLAQNNPGLVDAVNKNLTDLRSKVEWAAYPKGEAASPDLTPSPRAAAVPAPEGDLDERVAKARRALEGLKKVLGPDDPMIAQHEAWLKAVSDADGPEDYRKALAANPEADLEADNLGGLRKPPKEVGQYLTRQGAVLQEVEALGVPEDSRARVITSRDGLPVSQLDADVTDMHQRGVKLTDIADHIIEHSVDPEQAAIVAQLKPFLPENAKSVFRDGVTDKEGEYFPKQQTSALYNAADATTTSVHEMVHAVLSRALEGDSSAAQAVRGIYDQLKGKGDHAGITDAHEMVAEAFANSVYRDFLKSQFVQGTSLWDRFIDAARGIIGLSPRLYNAFDRIMSHGDDLMKEQQQYPNDAWVGPDSYARRADDGTGATAAGGDQIRETTFQRLKTGIGLNMRNVIRNGAFGWMDGYRLARLYGDVIPSMRPYVDTLSKVEAREGALLKASQVGYNMVRALPTEEQERLHAVMLDATFYGLDPQKPAPLDIQDTPGRVQLYQELVANWNQLSNAGKVAYEALRAKSSADYHAVLTDRLQTLERTIPGLNASNVFDTFDRRTDIHTNPRETEKFFKQAVADKVDGLTKYRDQLAGEQTTANAAIKAGGMSDDTMKELVRRSNALKTDIGSINAVLKEVATRRDAAAKAPYFHLGRDGNFFVTAKLATDFEGNVDPEKLAKFAEFLDSEGHNNVAVMQGGQHDTLYARVKNPSEMNALYQSVLKAQKQGLLSSEAGSTGAGEATTVFRSIAPEAMRKAVEAIQRPDAPEGLSDKDAARVDAAFGEQVADMQRTLLNMMAENSIGRVLARRANVQGFSKDMSESSQYASQVMSRSLARMTTAPETGALIGNMADEVRTANHDPAVDVNTKLAASQAVGELMLRDRLRTTYVPPTVLDALRHVSHTIHVGSSPAYFLTLMSQLMTTSLPELGKTHGYGQASQAMFRALPDTLAVIKAIAQGPDWNTAGITRDALEKAGLRPDLVDKVMGMVSRGVMGTAMYSTQMTQHSPLARGPTGTVLKAANAMGLYAELMPRLITGLAAHDLYNAKPYIEPRSGQLMSREQFIDRAINDSQGNWDASLNARQTSRGGTLGAAAPFVNQFMGWQIRMTGKIYNEVRDLFDAKTRPEATSWLLGHGAATAMLAGTLGLPLLSVGASVYDKLMDWVTNRDDHDLTASYRNFLAGTFGKDMGEVIARGLPRAAGMDFAHFGEATIVPGSSTINFAFEKRKLEDAYRDWLKSMGGAGAGDLFNFAAAVRDVSNGDYLNGLIKMSPEILKAPAEAYRLSQRGFVNNLTGQKLPISGPSAFDVAMTALGIDPGKQAEYQEVSRDAAGLRTMRELNSSNIVRHLEQAYMSGNRGMLNTWMGEAQNWQREHPGMVPPQVGFQRELENHIRQSAQAQGMGVPIGVTPRDIGARGALRYGNIGQQ